MYGHNYNVIFTDEELVAMLDSYGGRGQNIHATSIGLYGLWGDAYDLVVKNHVEGGIDKTMDDPRKMSQDVLFKLAEDAIVQMASRGWLVRDEEYPEYWHRKEG